MVWIAGGKAYASDFRDTHLAHSRTHEALATSRLNTYTSTFLRHCQQLAPTRQQWRQTYHHHPTAICEQLPTLISKIDRTHPKPRPNEETTPLSPSSSDWPSTATTTGALSSLTLTRRTADRCPYLVEVPPKKARRPKPSSTHRRRGQCATYEYTHFIKDAFWFPARLIINQFQRVVLRQGKGMMGFLPPTPPTPTQHPFFVTQMMYLDRSDPSSMSLTLSLTRSMPTTTTEPASISEASKLIVCSSRQSAGGWGVRELALYRRT